MMTVIMIMTMPTMLLPLSAFIKADNVDSFCVIFLLAGKLYGFATVCWFVYLAPHRD